jgi:hypothetical protein
MTEGKFREWLKKCPVDYLIHSGDVYVVKDTKTIVVTFDVEEDEKQDG